jgi:hypothetical protein
MSNAVDDCTLACAMLASRDDCTEDCQAARDAAAQAEHLLAAEDADAYWSVQFWLLASPPGELRLTPAGYPAGRVPVEFRAKWWREVERSAREMAEELEARLAKPRG